MWPNKANDVIPIITDACLNQTPKPAVTYKWFMMTSLNGNVTDLLWEESTGYRWIPLTKGQWCGAFIWAFIWFASEQTVAQTIETPVILDAIALITTPL